MTSARVAVLLALLAATAGCSSLGGDAEPERADIEFRETTGEAGVNYTDVRENGAGNGNAGVYAADYDRDGWPDVLALGGEHPRLFHNDEGTFEGSDALPTFDREFKSASWVDYDGDGFPDLFLLPRDGRPVVLENTGGQFERARLGLGNVSHPLGAAAADYDGDGDLDLFIHQSGDWTERKPEGYFSLEQGVTDDNGYPNQLYENVDGGYRRVTDAGIDGDRWSLAASFVDLTGDGRPDIHVANDYNNDTLYVNRGDGTFDRRSLGGATARNGMSSEVADVTGDGRPDVFVTNIELPISRSTLGPERYERLKHLFTFVIHSGRTEGNTLLVNDFEENDTFVDRADGLGVRVGGWGWASSVTDLNNDGDRDVIHATQNVVRIDQEDPTFTYPMVFERASNDSFARLDAGERGLGEDDGRGMVTTDYDRDGDVDVISANYLDSFTVYENTVAGQEPTANAITLRAVTADGATAHGATLTVETDDRTVRLFQHSRTDFLSQDPRRSHVGVGTAETVTVRVRWPDGTERPFEEVAVGQVVRLTPDGPETVLTYRDARKRTDANTTAAQVGGVQIYGSSLG